MLKMHDYIASHNHAALMTASKIDSFQNWRLALHRNALPVAGATRTLFDIKQWRGGIM